MWPMRNASTEFGKMDSFQEEGQEIFKRVALAEFDGLFQFFK
jgi:hypothetical protein